MEYKRIKDLLEAFYEGEISPEGLSELRDFFENASAIPEAWAADKKLFQLLSQDDAEIMPEEISRRLEKQIDGFEEKKPQRHSKKRKIVVWASSAAAAVLIGAVSFVMTRPSHNAPKDTFSDPQEAAAFVEDALFLVSSNLNKGIAQLEKAQKELHQAKNIVENQFNTIRNEE